VILNTQQTEVKPKAEENKDAKAQSDAEARKALRAMLV